MKLKELYEKLYNKIFSVPLFAKLLKIPMLEKLLQYEIVSYLVFGVLTTVVNFAVYKGIALLIGDDYKEKIVFSLNKLVIYWPLVINAIAWVAAVLFSFITSKLFVFESTSWKIGVFFKEIVSFFGARIISFIIFEELIFALLTIYIGINDIVAKIILAVFVVIFNYVASKLFIFRKKGEK